MVMLAKDPATIFIGYGLKRGRAGGTIPEVPDSMLIETPVAENLMTGLAIGLSLAGRRPLVYFERFDFALNAADAIVNHLDKAKDISRGEFDPGVLFRCVVGNENKPLYTGMTHTRNHSDAFRSMLRFPVAELATPQQVKDEYEASYVWGGEGTACRSSMLVEFKELL